MLDVRSASSKHIYQLLLLAASWHRHVRHTAALEVLVIGNAAADLLEFLCSLKAQVKAVPPDPNDRWCKTSNTITGACEPAEQRILLVDNDIVFWGPLRELCKYDRDYVYGAVAGSSRINSAQWLHITSELGFAPLQSARATLKELLRASADPKYTPRTMNEVYVNGGVLLLPINTDFGLAWRHCVGEIADVFHHHPLRSKSVSGSNMAGLAMAIAAHGKFRWLDDRLNYRPKCFALGLEGQERIEIVHMTGFDAAHVTVSARIDDYYQTKIYPLFRALASSVPKAELDKRLCVATTFKEELMSLIECYDLDVLAGRLLTRAPHPDKKPDSTVMRFEQISNRAKRLHHHITRKLFKC